VKPRLVLRQTQKLALTPVVRMSLSILRMAPADLTEEIAREAERNPFLRHEAPRIGPARGATPAATPAEPAAREASFQESLRGQLSLMALPEATHALALFLVSELREDGILDVSLDELAEETGAPLTDLEQALAALQSCDPAGIGARDLRECLELRLVDQGLSRPDAAATVADMALFAARDWAGIARKLGIDRAEAEHRAALLRRLSPRPVRANDAAPVLAQPDLILTRDGTGTLGVTVNARHLPTLRIDPALLAHGRADRFAPELLERARALIAALEQRGRTLQRIGDWLVARQAGFFLRGPDALRPATRAELAADLGLHPATVGRAIAGKAIDVDGRLWPLSSLFSTALPGPNGDVSARAVQRRILALVAEEPPGRPLSDAALTDALRAEGVDIARRTVAKYRQGLRIPATATRRRIASSRDGGPAQPELQARRQ
jgi:RNA polymerase sigma-54 factor